MIHKSRLEFEINRGLTFQHLDTKYIENNTSKSKLNDKIILALMNTKTWLFLYKSHIYQIKKKFLIANYVCKFA